MKLLKKSFFSPFPPFRICHFYLFSGPLIGWINPINYTSLTQRIAGPLIYGWIGYFAFVLHTILPQKQPLIDNFTKKTWLIMTYSQVIERLMNWRIQRDFFKEQKFWNHFKQSLGIYHKGFKSNRPNTRQRQWIGFANFLTVGIYETRLLWAAKMFRPKDWLSC